MQDVETNRLVLMTLFLFSICARSTIAIFVFFSLFFVTPTCLSNYRVLTDGMRYFARRASDIDRNRMTIEEFSFVDGQKKKAKKMNWKDGQH